VNANITPPTEIASQNGNEIEGGKWERNSDGMIGEVWINEGSIEGKVPSFTMERNNARSIGISRNRARDKKKKNQKFMSSKNL